MVDFCPTGTMAEISDYEKRVMMFYDFRRGLTSGQSHESLAKALGNDAPKLHTVEVWFHKFREGIFSFEDAPRSGRPKEAVTPENVDRVRELIKVHRNITYEEIEEELGIGANAVHSILHDHLGVKKMVSRWIPHLLSSDQKRHRVEWCQFMLQKFNEGQSKRVADIVTGDETWLFNYDPGTKADDTVWVFEGEPHPTKVVRGRSAAKQMVAIFLRRSGLVATVPLEHGKTVNAEWYCGTCLAKVFEALEQKRPHAGLQGILLHHDNAPAHTAAPTLDFLHERGVQLVSHPPYSPDLAICDFGLFPEMKEHLRGKRFQTSNEAVAAMNEFFDMMPVSFYQELYDKWFWRMKKVIAANGEYFEKL